MLCWEGVSVVVVKEETGLLLLELVTSVAELLVEEDTSREEDSGTREVWVRVVEAVCVVKVLITSVLTITAV